MLCLFWLCLGLVLGVSSAGLGLLVCLCCVSFAWVIFPAWCALCVLCLFVVGGVLFVCLLFCLFVMVCGFLLWVCLVLICWCVLPVWALPGSGSWCEFCWVGFVGLLSLCGIPLKMCLFVFVGVLLVCWYCLVGICCVCNAWRSFLVCWALVELCLFVVDGVLFVCLVCFLSVVVCGFLLELSNCVDLLVCFAGSGFAWGWLLV